MKYKPNRLLSICVPTYNRSRSLAEMLNLLTEAIAGHEADLEVVISDNCSPDETNEVILSWKHRQSSNLAITSIRQSTNVGASRNVVALLYLSSSDYFMFLGDDDRLNPGNFKRLLQLLAEKRPSAVIQTMWPGRAKRSRSGIMNFDEALSFFYEYGNAWAGIVDRCAAIAAIDTRSLRKQIETNVWPQTIFGYLAMYDLSPLRPVEAVDYEIGRPLSESLNLTNKSYWIRSLNDLLQAATILQNITSTSSVSQSFVSFRSPGLTGHIRAIFLYTIVDADKSSLSELRILLSRNFSLRGRIAANILRISECPSILNLFVALFGRVIKTRNGQCLSEAVAREKDHRSSELQQIHQSGKRFGDWF
jgi:glycosyltransferase involved in cell wall biosynthesis